MKAEKITKKQTAMPSPYRLMASLAFLSVVCVGLLALRISFSDSTRYTFLLWNLVLAILPALLAWWLIVRVRSFGWFKWQQILLSVLWVGFLPNSFYLITDLIHLRPNYEADLLFDITLLISFIMAGLLFGFISVYMVHSELVRRLRERSVYAMVAGLFLAASFAIYLGRYTRWNTWDVVFRPAGLLFDVSDRFINPDAHLQTYHTTLILFLVLFSSYAVVYESARLLKASR